MKKSQILSFPVLLILGVCGVIQAQDEPQVEFKQVSISAQFDNGQVVSGRTDQFEINPNFVSNDLSGRFLSRTSVWVTQDAIVNKRLELIAGVGGIFWYALPATPKNIPENETEFGPALSQAQGIYTFGDLNNPPATLQMGYFPYKYNSDAKNLGEYLLRSGTYPGYLVSGGWNMVSSAAYMVEGLRLHVTLWGGKFESDFLLPMEHDLPPLYSFSPTYVATLRPVSGLQIGAGIDCNHCLSVKPSAESPHTTSNQVIDSAVFDTTTHLYTYYRDTSSYYSFQGVKLMGSVSFDPKAYFPMPMLGSEDLKIYSEVALLGVKNYSYMYNDRWQRMPVMVGLNLPTFKLLDVLSIEGEYYNSNFTNDLESLYEDQSPTWDIPDQNVQASTSATTTAKYLSNVKRDNWKWSVYAKKNIIKGVQVYAQVASDHFRPYNFNLGAFPAMVPVTNRNGKDWYYIVRLQFGI